MMHGSIMPGSTTQWFMFPADHVLAGLVPATEVTSLVSMVDIKPTVLDFVGMPEFRAWMDDPFGR